MRCDASHAQPPDPKNHDALTSRELLQGRREPQVAVRTAHRPATAPKSKAVRERAVLALLTSKTIGTAADQVGVGERTLRRWMTDDEAFKRDLAEARQALFDASMNRVHVLASEAVDTLAALMAQEDHPSVGAMLAHRARELAKATGVSGERGGS
jgi:hypothetical protein